MNTANWHLLLNHLPVIGTLIGMLLLLSGFILQNNYVVKRTALGVFIFSAVMAIPAYLTGEGAEEVVEKLPGVTENIIDRHEDLGKLFFIIVEALGVLSLITFLAEAMRGRISNALYFTVLLVAVVSMIFAKQAGTSGGEIRHTEIRSASPTSVNEAVTQQSDGAENKEGEKDND